MANIDNVQLPDGSSYNIVDNTSGFASQSYVDSAVSSITKTTIGLGNVDNTSDLNKPISTATQTALDTLDEDKSDKTDLTSISIAGSTNNTGNTIAKGRYFYKDGILVTAKTNIANGATLTENTNYTVVTTGALNLLLDTMPYTARISNLPGNTINDFFKNVDIAIREVCPKGRGFTTYLDWQGHRSFLIQGMYVNTNITFFIAVSNADATSNYVVYVSGGTVTTFTL